MFSFDAFNLTTLFAILIPILFGIFFLGSSFRSYLKSKAGQSWRSVQGKVIESKVIENTYYSNEGGKETNYRAQVRYVYSVNGQEYTGDRFCFGEPPGPGNDEAKETVAKYPADARVPVYYDPKKPQNAVLEKSAGGLSYKIGCGILFLILGIAMGLAVFSDALSRL